MLLAPGRYNQSMLKKSLIALWIVLASLSVWAGREVEFHQACGIRVGEVTGDSAIVWTRITQHSSRNSRWLRSHGGGPDFYLPPGMNVGDLEGEVPGMAGRVRIRYGVEGGQGESSIPWVGVGSETDFTRKFQIGGLKPGTRYWLIAETSSADGRVAHAPLKASFRTRATTDFPTDVLFTVVTGLMYKDLDGSAGFRIFETMRKLRPGFIVMTGDNVYYDNEYPRANSQEIARYHWHRMFSLPRHIAFFLEVPAYWQKDDHDIYFDDCWPSLNRKEMSPFTFADGQRIFLEQTPAPAVPYRTIRWGRDLQVWLTEGRDFRTPNTAPDGPSKSIWGETQRRWLKETLIASDATWKVLVSPTPIVGPDRPTKRDNHTNAAFAWEGNEFRQWAKRNLPGRFFVACGDRHWQYHSVHPETGVTEFSCGPASDAHAGGTPGEDPRYHRFHRVKGGFLSVEVRGGSISFRLHDVAGTPVYRWSPR